MQTYLVGGAVRDKLLNRKVTDRDYVVIGATVEEMVNKGFRQVGKDFPVFLHPKTNDEYALARTERKKGYGHKGFECDASTDITLEQDLLRRDLTINAMAMDEQGNVIDPYGGQEDLKNRNLRHVSDAFEEDPLRVLRVARFAARFANEGFAVDDATLKLMQKISLSGELKTLSASRVWQETARALLESKPEVFFLVLKSVEGLRDWFTELDHLWGIPNPATWHPEIDTGVHTMMVLQKAVSYSDALEIRYAALVHDLGKALTDTTNWPSHHGHDELGIKAIKQMNERLGVPNDCRDLALMTSEHHSIVHRLFQKSAEDVLAAFNGTDAWRKPERFKQFLLVCKADFKGRKNFDSRIYEPMEVLWFIFKKCQLVTAQPFVEQGLKGTEIRDAINSERLKIITQLLDEKSI